MLMNGLLQTVKIQQEHGAIMEINFIGKNPSVTATPCQLPFQGSPSCLP